MKAAFGYVILYVENVPSAMLFYEKVFGFSQSFITEDNEYGELETPPTKLAFAERSFIEKQVRIPFGDPKTSKKTPPFEIGFTVEDVEYFYQKALQAGAKEVLSPTRKPWGQVVAYILDPNSYLVEICSKIENTK